MRSRRETPTPIELRLASENITMLDWFATFAPEPTKDEMDVERMREKNRADRDENYTRRHNSQIRCALRYKYARFMLEARLQRS